MTKFSIIFLVMSFFAGCSSILPYRSYSDIMDAEDEGFWKPGRDFPVVSGDSGKMRMDMDELRKRSPEAPKAAFYRKENQYANVELAHLEARMTEEEAKHYQTVEALLGTPERKIYYLRLSPAEKTSYIDLLQNGTTRVVSGRFPASSDMDADYPDLQTQRREFKSHLLEAVQSYRGDVYLGMKKEEVISQWGQPDFVEVAGNPRFENERWTFRTKQGVSIVYFESGKVRGWQQN